MSHYIVRVLEDQRNHTILPASGPFYYVVSGLLPYKVYSVVAIGCTATACRNSLSSKVRTGPGPPSEQSPPTATPLTSTSVRVTWIPPAVPGGRIINFVLYRRTLDEPLTMNFTVTPYVEVYSGIVRSFVDRNLGIFSLQQYKVLSIELWSK